MNTDFETKIRFTREGNVGFFINPFVSVSIRVHPWLNCGFEGGASVAAEGRRGSRPYEGSQFVVYP